MTSTKLWEFWNPLPREFTQPLFISVDVICECPILQNDHSIIFVLFDMEEPGCYGSLEFIRTFLIPQFVERGIQIQGSSGFHELEIKVI